MPSFAESFWTPDYVTGLAVLHGKLQQGILENQQLLSLASLRADAEEAYSGKLAQIAPAVDGIGDGFMRDDGASARKAFEGVRGEMVAATKSHSKIALSIRDLVVRPFGRWAGQHAARVEVTYEELQVKIKEYNKQAEVVKKLRSSYFNKCRLVEDLEEENKLAFQGPDSRDSPQSPVSKPPTIVLSESFNEDDGEPVELGDIVYPPEKLKELFSDMLGKIPLGDFKFGFLGTYQNTAIGTDIVEYLQKHQHASTVSYAERIGQDLVDQGFFRLVGTVGNTFANSSKLNYQFRSKLFKIAGVPEKKKPLNRAGSAAISDETADSPTVTAVAEMLSSWNPLNNPYPNETPGEKLHRESREADTRYRASVKKLDRLRCNLEENIIDYLRFMERCELDRLRAVKAVILDFSGAIGNVIPTLRSTVDQMMLFQETIQPLGDLRYLLESYRTGAFVPRVTPYENYYGSVEDQTFGVDLEARARADKKRVPMIVTNILTFLDSKYPDLEGDDARRAIWLIDVPLLATHHLRAVINNGQAVPAETLEKFDIPVVANVLKLYLLELPDSLVSSQVYEIVRTIYTTTGDAPADNRIKVIQSTLSQLRLNNIATLDAIVTHFSRLIELTSADDNYVSALVAKLAPCILRPRLDNNLTMEEKYNARLLRDLFEHRQEIFGALKRNSSSSHASSSSRPRTTSMTDESNRRAAMEARAKAIMERTRAVSPVPSPRHHRRDRSSNGSTRFPINIHSPPQQHNRRSLGVPGHDEDHSPPTSGSTSVASRRQSLAAANGSSASPDGPIASRMSANITDFSSTDDLPVPVPEPVQGEKRTSLTRGGSGGARRYSRKSNTSLANSSTSGSGMPAVVQGGTPNDDKDTRGEGNGSGSVSRSGSGKRMTPPPSPGAAAATEALAAATGGGNGENEGSGAGSGGSSGKGEESGSGSAERGVTLTDKPMDDFN